MSALKKDEDECFGGGEGGADGESEISVKSDIFLRFAVLCAMQVRSEERWSSKVVVVVNTKG